MQPQLTSPPVYFLPLVIIVLNLLTIVRPASADSPQGENVELRVGADGFLSSWLQIGPLPMPGKSSKDLKTIVSRDSLQLSKGNKSPRHGEYLAGGTWKAQYRSKRLVSLSGRRQAITYLAAVLHVSSAQKIRLATGSDGGLGVWLNGEHLFAATERRRAVPDTDMVSLDLKAGPNVLVIKLVKPIPGAWRFYARLLNEDFTVADDVRVVLPGATTPVGTVLKRTGRLALVRDVDLEAGAVAMRVRLVFSGGRPLGDTLETLITFLGPNAPPASKNELSLAPGKKANYELGIFHFKERTSPATVVADIGGAVFKTRLGFHQSTVRRLAQAAAHMKAGLNNLEIPLSGRESVAWRVEHLRELISNGDQDYRYIARELKTIQRLTGAIAGGKDPFFNRRNELQRRGYRSSIDDRFRYYALYVPPGWREKGKKEFGLIVTLHGMNGTPMKSLRAVFGEPMDPDETNIKRERRSRPVAPAPMFVLAPSGFGNTGYRELGEVDVLEALEQICQRYRIDPNRIYITGNSMGGIGAASLPLHYPDKFAAMAPLAGYHSLLSYHSIRRAKLAPWEEFLVRVRSNVFWAENGKHVPLYAVHGKKDIPRHTRVLVDRYSELGYKVEFETPELGHNVWDQTYADGWVFKHFAPLRRVAHPRHVVLRTGRARYRKSHWLEIDSLINYAEFAELNGRWQVDNEICVETENVRSFTLYMDPQLRDVGKPLVVQLDGQPISLANEEVDSLRFYKQGEDWKVGCAPFLPGLHKKPGFAGPINDAYYEPLLFVYSTGNPGENALTKRLIEELRRPRRGVTVDWQVKADVDVTEQDLADYSIVVVGTVTGNKLLARIEKQLPIRAYSDSIVLGKKRFTGEQVAASFIYPNPLNPERYVVVHTAVSLSALFYVNHLPEILPDYVIYDGSGWTRRRGRILNGRLVLDGGFFDVDWKL